jgi:hypothetical protein
LQVQYQDTPSAGEAQKQCSRALHSVLRVPDLHAVPDPACIASLRHHAPVQTFHQAHILVFSSRNSACQNTPAARAEALMQAPGGYVLMVLGKMFILLFPHLRTFDAATSSKAMPCLFSLPRIPRQVIALLRLLAS